MDYISEKEAREIVVEAGHRLVETHLAERTWGNISMRISERHFIITPSGRSYGEMKREDLPVVSIDDLSWSGPYKPSSEKGMHAEIYKVRPDASVIIHTHQDMASIISVAGNALSGVPAASYAMSSTKVLAKSVSAAFLKNQSAKAVLMPHHGAVCIGKNMDEAFGHAEELEKKAAEKVLPLVEALSEPACDYGMSRRKDNGFVLTYAGNTGFHKLDEKTFPAAIHAAIYERYGNISCIGTEKSPPTAAVAALKRTVHPSIDDLAMIAGSSIRYAEPDCAAKALKERNAVYLPGAALCIASDEDDLEALFSLIRKGSLAELYRSRMDGGSVPRLSAIIERLVYVKKYSKMKR